MDRRSLRARFCFNCGTTIIPGHRSCLNCGTEFEPEGGDLDSASGRAAPPEALPAGTLLGERYAIEGFLDSSRLHVSYRALDRLFKRAVILKTLRSKEQSLPSRRAEFRHQCALQSALQHRHIVATLDFFEERMFDVEVCVQQHVSGVHLKRWLSRLKRPMPLPRLTFRHLMLPVTSAIAYAHRHGVVHRNLKPAKIVFDRFERPLVSDFGLSSYAIPRARAGNMPAIVGTLEYMAPEQADDPGSVDLRSDIYSLGVIFYEIVCGELPVEGANDLELLSNLIQAQPVPLIERAPDVPPGLDAVIMQCLSKRPEHRFQSADQLLLRLSDVLDPPDA